MIIRHLDLFSGIGGFALAAEMAWGRDNVQHTFCEIEPFCQAVLKKHWPGATIYGDIKKLKAKPGSADIITGGFPCQPFSRAGARKGSEDDRWLWPDMLRVIREVRAPWVVVENVAHLTEMEEFEVVCSDLEAASYEVQPFIIPACAVGAPHRRDRVWVVAYSHSQSESNGALYDNQGRGELGAAHYNTDPECFSVQGWPEDSAQGQAYTRAEQLSRLLSSSLGHAVSNARVYRADNGVSSRLDIHRNKALGNAIVPQVAAEVLKAVITL